MDQEEVTGSRFPVPGLAETQPGQPSVRTELGLEVPVKEGEEYREHTAERWRERDPTSFEYCIHLIRNLGIVNRSELERQVDAHRAARNLKGISRNCIIALINDTNVFKPGEITDIIARGSALLTMESIGAARELVEKAKSTKDLGAMAMVMTSANNIKQITGGGPTSVKVVHHKFDVEDFEAARRKRLNEGGTIVDVPAAQAVAVMRQEGEA